MMIKAFSYVKCTSLHATMEVCCSKHEVNLLGLFDGITIFTACILDICSATPQYCSGKIFSVSVITYVPYETKHGLQCSSFWGKR